MHARRRPSVRFTMRFLWRELWFVGESVQQALATLRAHPLRTGLGALAVFVAVFTVATVITALEGVGAYARLSAARAFGSDSFVVAQVASPGQIGRRELERKLQRSAVSFSNGPWLSSEPVCRRHASILSRAMCARQRDICCVFAT